MQLTPHSDCVRGDSSQVIRGQPEARGLGRAALRPLRLDRTGAPAQTRWHWSGESAPGEAWPPRQFSPLQHVEDKASSSWDLGAGSSSGKGRTAWECPRPGEVDARSAGKSAVARRRAGGPTEQSQAQGAPLPSARAPRCPPGCPGHHAAPAPPSGLISLAVVLLKFVWMCVEVGKVSNRRSWHVQWETRKHWIGVGLEREAETYVTWLFWDSIWTISPYPISHLIRTKHLHYILFSGKSLLPFLQIGTEILTLSRMVLSSTRHCQEDSSNRRLIHVCTIMDFKWSYSVSTFW